MDEVTTVPELLRALDRLRSQAARGQRSARVSLRKLESLTGIPRSSLSSYLTGATKMPIDVLDSIIIALGVPPAEARRWADVWERANSDRPIPANLPPAPPDFVGREDALASLNALKHHRVIVITGTAGVGKTSLALHWAHRFAARFPDGTFYINLHGYDGAAPMTADDLTECVLHTITKTSNTAEGEDLWSACRTELSRKRLLLMLDNARSTEQLRHLVLPGPATLLITSRDSMQGLVARDGARRLQLQPFTVDEAAALLPRLIEPQRLDDHAAAINKLCSGLPLALRLVAERIARYPNVAIAELIAELQARTLDLLTADGDPLADVRAALSWSYQVLPPDCARLFRLLSLIPTTSFDTATAAALDGAQVDRTAARLETLERAHLVERPTADRYALHDLLKAYASELLDCDDDRQGRQSAVQRILDRYLLTASSAMSVIRPRRRPVPLPTAASVAEFDGYDHAMAWLDLERDGITAACDMAANAAITGGYQYGWQLAVIMSPYLKLRGRTSRWLATHEKALEACMHGRDRQGEAEVRSSLGVGLNNIGRYDQAADQLSRALSVWTDVGDAHGRATAMGNLGVAYDMSGRADDAIACYQAAGMLYRQLGDHRGEAVSLANLACVWEIRGDFAQALRSRRRAMAIYEDIGETRNLAILLTNLATMHIYQADFVEAARAARRALSISQDLGDLNTQGVACTALAEVGLHTRDPESTYYLEQGLALTRETGDQQFEAIGLALTALHQARSGNTAEATSAYAQAIALAREMSDPQLQCRCLNDRAYAHLDVGAVESAIADFTAAHEIAHAAGLLYDQVRSAVGLAITTPDGDQAAAFTAEAAAGMSTMGFGAEHPLQQRLSYSERAAR
ncbi:MAG: tetratricopeptide repeat protein [Hamadaea sp.]|uniref:ATP-binding protein n=1 Tax=Hamadaea sp. TaxID=2024425 RepID=UPI001818367B|nr:tetratricopeptide repeat protein [Hamadaea sp.]NUR72830.1 tetratricopeptide repeat protein [Hamadaea sp.]NUT20455.1 tetratricopeptide repeat protein [Hamadaea sp.]